MGALLALIAKQVAYRLAHRTRAGRYLWLIPILPIILILGMVFVVGLFVAVEAGALNSGNCGTSSPTPPGSNVATAAAITRYFESQGISANGSAGITGNLQQENSFSPVTNSGGVGIAQWDPVTRGPAMQTWDRQHGLDPATVQGQLTYLVYDLQTTYAKLLAELNSAPDPGTAATMFETVYESCLGVVGYMQVIPNSACNDSGRRQYAFDALQAAGGGTPGTVLASFNPAGTCVASGGTGGDPIPGFTPGRDDMGVDGCAKPGMPIYAPAASTLVSIQPNWYNGQPLMLFLFNPPLAGTYQNDQYWYVAEEIVPASITPGTQFAAGQPVATYAPSGTCIEIGWGSPTNGSRTLIPTDANPPAGALTPEGEAFKVYFHIPWVGQSP